MSRFSVCWFVMRIMLMRMATWFARVTMMMVMIPETAETRCHALASSGL